MKKTKFKVAGMIMVVFMLMLCMLSVSANNDISVYVDADPVYFDVPPVIENGRTLVPMRAIFEKLGATVEWDAATQTAKATKNDIIVSIKIGNPSMAWNDTSYGISEFISLDVPAKIIDGRTLIPLRAVSEAFGCKVGWDGKDRVISIISEYNMDVVMLYAPEGRSRAFEFRSVCEQLANGWYETSWNVGNYISDVHRMRNSELVCERCGKYAPVYINMTEEEIAAAKKVTYISNREIWYDKDNYQFVFTFSLLDAFQEAIAVPAVVNMWIENYNGEVVYDITRSVTTADYGYWKNNATGETTYRCAIYIDKNYIEKGTSDKGIMNFYVNNEYVSFDLSKLVIEGNLPTFN